MTATTIRVQMAQRKDTAANWTAANPILLSGEIGYETNTKKFKIGDGSTAWNSLAYLPIPDGSGNLTITGNLEIGSTGSLTFEGSTADGFETTLAVTNPTADRTITLPNQSGTVLVSGNASIVDADIAANAEIAVSKLADGAARQLLQTDAAGTGVEWTSNIDVPGTLDVTNTATFDSIAQYPAGSAAAPTITFTGDTNTGLFSPGSDQLALATGGTGRLYVDASGNVLIGAASAVASSKLLVANVSGNTPLVIQGGVAESAALTFYNNAASTNRFIIGQGYSSGTDNVAFIQNNANAALAFGTNASERMRLDSSGRLGLGTSSPATNLDIRGTNSAQLRIGSTSGDLGNNTEIGTLEFFNSDANQNAIAAYVRATRGGGFGSGGYLTFGVSASGSSASAATEALRIDESGRVGIGVTGPGESLHVNGNIRMSAVPGTNTNAALPVLFQASTGTIDGGSSLTFNPANDALSVNGFNISSTLLSATGNIATLTCTNGSGQYDFRATNDSLRFISGSSEAARFDGSQRLLVGTSTSTNNIRLGQKTAVVSTGDDFGGLSLTSYCGTDSGKCPVFDLQRSRGTTDGSLTEVVANDALGYLVFRGADGVSFSDAAHISAWADGDWTTSGDTTDSPGRLVFSTTADGASSPTERMRIDSAGRFMVGTTSDGGADGLTIYPAGSGAGSAAIGVWNKTNTSSEGAAQFRVGGSTIGSITYSNTAVAYNTTSDYRLKENVTPLTGAADRLNQLQVHRFNFIAAPDKSVDGFIAHEAQAVVPECVTGTKDEVDDDGNPVYQGIDQSKLVPLLTAALQEAIGEIESLKARLTAAGI